LGTTTPTVEAALSDVEQWQSDQADRNQSELAEVEQEMESLRTAIANLQEQLAALEEFKAQVTGRSDSLGREGILKAYDAIFAALQEQAAQVVQRAALVAEAEAERLAALPDSLRQSEVASLVDEFEQFKDTEASLASLPESYRTVVVQHHQQVVDKLRDHINALMAGPVEVRGDTHAVEVVYAIDAPDGTPELLVVVVPVSDQTHTAWRERDEDLQSWIAARVVQGIYAASAEAHHPVQAMCGGHRGLLAIEVDLLGAPPRLSEAFQERISSLLSEAPELKAAHLVVTAREVSIDYLLPPEDDTESSLDDVELAPAASEAQEAADAG
jgi:hypothetical protein